VRSDAIDVDSYLTQVPEGRRAVLTEIRDACRMLLAGFAEAMSYGMPTYSRDGIAELAWASQRRTRAVTTQAPAGQLPDPGRPTDAKPCAAESAVSAGAREPLPTGCTQQELVCARTSAAPVVIGTG